ncbi:MAG: ribonuclease P protein component [Prolixibacteraceae bacterium]|nr:ribonuclease P protein component [Prolixibacteraceae bacterium]
MRNISGSNKINYSFSKSERLCSKKLFDALFSGGTSILVYPIKIIFTEVPIHGDKPAQAAFAVSRKIFRKAVTRNLIKRRMREAYRLNKHYFYTRLGDKELALIFIYVGKEILDFHKIESSLKRGLNSIVKNLF